MYIISVYFLYLHTHWYVWKSFKETRSYHLHLKHLFSICIIVAVVVSSCYTPQTIWEICFFAHRSSYPPSIAGNFHEILVFMNHVSIYKYALRWDTITITSFCQKPPQTWTFWQPSAITGHHPFHPNKRFILAVATGGEASRKGVSIYE